MNVYLNFLYHENANILCVTYLTEIAHLLIGNQTLRNAHEKYRITF
jgi:hypothetical protein